MPVSTNSTNTAAGIKVRRLTGSIGAEITGVDLEEPFDDGAFAVLRDAFLEHITLVFPGQERLTPSGLKRFGDHWGEVILIPYLVANHAVDEAPEVLKLTNPGKAKVVTERWHSDTPYFTDPPAITVLQAKELPEVGGDTMWSNQYLAFETLSPMFQDMLRPMKACFAGIINDPDTGQGNEVGTWHPLVRKHPETGREALNLGHPGDALTAIEGLRDEESMPILNYLFEHCSRPDFVYRHTWRPGDVLMWDNRACVHYAVHDYGDAPRLMHRITVRR